jgi:Acetyltransferase (GNAT) domain
MTGTRGTRFCLHRRACSAASNLQELFRSIWLTRRGFTYCKTIPAELRIPFSVDVPSLPLGGVENVPLSDTVSPEYRGPLARGAPIQHLAIEFLKKFSMFAFNPKRGTGIHSSTPVEGVHVGNCLEFNRKTVHVDLTRTDEQLWRISFTHACRKNINRSQRENVRVFEAQTMGDVREFYRLYVETMKRRNTLNHYYVSPDYFSAIFDHLGGNSRFVLAEHRNQVIAGILYLYDRDDVYSYLGGARITIFSTFVQRTPSFTTRFFGASDKERKGWS